MAEKNPKDTLQADLLAALSLQEEMGATALLDDTPRIRKPSDTGKNRGRDTGQDRGQDTAQNRSQETRQAAQVAQGVEDTGGARDRALGGTRGDITGTLGDGVGDSVGDGVGDGLSDGLGDGVDGMATEAKTASRRAKKPVFSAEVADAQKAAAEADSLEALWQAIESFEGCSLRAGANSTVIWRGNPQARLAIIGEAPGADEDAQGKPFVGRAGKLLDGLLHWAGFDESQVFISNIVFWRPPKNRAPEPAEVSVCLPFVWKQLALLKPEIVLLLGNTPLKAMLPRLGASGITRARGHWTSFADEDTGGFAKEPETTQAALQMPVYGSFHPAYLLRSPQQTRFAWADLLAVAEKYEARTGDRLQSRP